MLLWPRKRRLTIRVSLDRNGAYKMGSIGIVSSHISWLVRLSTLVVNIFAFTLIRYHAFLCFPSRIPRSLSQRSECSALGQLQKRWYQFYTEFYNGFDAAFIYDFLWRKQHFGIRLSSAHRYVSPRGNLFHPPRCRSDSILGRGSTFSKLEFF